MTDRTDGLDIETIEGVNVVSLKVVRGAGLQGRSSLAAPLGTTTGDPWSCWVGPDHWLLMSRKLRASEMIAHCKSDLEGIVHNAVDYSSGLAGFRLVGGEDILACGTAVDLRSEKFPPGSCVRTRLAQIPAQIIRTQSDAFEIWVDRSYADWLRSWLADTAEISAMAGYANAGADCTRREQH